MSHRDKNENLMREYAGRAAIGRVRYATCGRDDRSYAQPFERHHLQKHKWFSLGFNGQLANYQQLRDRLLSDDDHHLARETDTEIIMHEITHFDLPAEHWRHVRTTNGDRVALRHGSSGATSDQAGSRTKGLTMAWKLLDMAQARWRRLNGSQLLPLVRAGAAFVNGIKIERTGEKKNAA